MHFRKKPLSFPRSAALITGAASALLAFLLPHLRLPLSIAAGTGFALGITNFGRQCPLMLSINHLAARFFKKRELP
jgi:hypothetical protein